MSKKMINKFAMKINVFLNLICIPIAIIFTFSFFSCNSNKKLFENVTKEKDKFLEALMEDSTNFDTIYFINEKFCFPIAELCLDSFVYIKDSIADIQKFELSSYQKFKGIDIDRNINIFPAVLDNENNVSILRKFINMLNTQNKILTVDLDRYFKIQKRYLDSVPIKTSYYFDYKNKNSIHIIDTLHIEYWHNSTIIKGPINVELELNIFGEDNLNQLKVIHKKSLFEDHEIHEYKSVNQNCKNFIFNLKLITYNEDLIGAEYYLPLIWTFCEKEEN